MIPLDNPIAVHPDAKVMEVMFVTSSSEVIRATIHEDPPFPIVFMETGAGLIVVPEGGDYGGSTIVASCCVLNDYHGFILASLWGN
jgi:hypothetical protein